MNTRVSLLCGCAAVLVLTGCAPEITSPTAARGRVGDPFTYQITATEDPTSFSADVPPPAGLSVDPALGLISGTPSQAGTFVVNVRAKNADGEGSAQVTLSIAAAPVAHHEVVNAKELLITNAAILGDPRARPGGAWHFRSALGRIAGVDGAALEAFATAWFNTWTTATTIPGTGDTFSVRPVISGLLQDAWTNNRIELIAIVNRIDLTRLDSNDVTRPPTRLGEGRFVYEVRGPTNAAERFTLIFEYGLPAPSGDLEAELRRWAQAWHALGATALGGPTEFPEAYRAALQAITDEFSAHGTLNQIRTNEFAGTPEWELREFHFDAGAVRLVQVPVAITPAIEFNNSPALADFINTNEASILAEGVASIPAALQGAVSPVASPSFRWSASTSSSRARFITSFNTCSGCHAGDTGTFFQHISSNVSDGLSPFMKGAITLDEALPGRTTTQHDEMDDRRVLLALFAEDVPPTRAARFVPDALNPIIKARANRRD